MEKAFQWLLLLGIIGNTMLGNAACAPIHGAEQLWSKPSLRWIWVGETHGSNEAPAAFAELVCNALANGKHVGVALERPTREQSALQGMLASQELSDAKRTLLNQPSWQDFQDGRSSRAMLELLLSLRELHKQYPTLQVYAVDGPSYTADRGSRDEAIGKSVLSIGMESPGNLIFVLTENVHAMKEPLDAGGIWRPEAVMFGDCGPLLLVLASAIA